MSDSAEGWEAGLGWSRYLWAEEERRLLSGINGHGASAREEGEIGGEMGFSVEDVAVLLVGGWLGETTVAGEMTHREGEKLPKPRVSTEVPRVLVSSRPSPLAAATR